MNDAWVNVAAAVAVVAAIAYIVAEIVGRFARGALTGILHREPAGAASPAVRRPIRIVRVAVFLAVFAALLLPALDLIGVGPRVGVTSATLSEWFFGSGLRIVVIAILAYVVVRIIAALARRLEEELGREETPDMVERMKRARTLSRLVQNALTTTVVVIAALMMLRELRVDITPILTSAGILGLAVGFGAQTLVKDLIAGFFLTFENQVRVGDVATINGTGGLVEVINLRTIVLRDITGAVHVFPNGSIERLSNLTKDFSYYVIDVGVSVQRRSRRRGRRAPDYRPRAPGGSATRSEHPGAAGGAGGRCVRGVAGHPQNPNQDAAAETVGSGPRDAAAH